MSRSADPNSTPAKANIVIIGAGLIGVSTAYYLTRNQNIHPESSITLVEEVNVGTGSSGYSSGLLNKHEFGDGQEEEGESSNLNQELSNGGFQLHQQLSKEYQGDSNWGHREIDLYDVEIIDQTAKLNSNSTSPSSALSSSSSTSDPLSFLPTISSTSVRRKGDSSSTGYCQPSKLTRHLCGLFLSHPGATLLIAKAISITTSSGVGSDEKVTHDEAGKGTAFSSSSKADGNETDGSLTSSTNKTSTKRVTGVKVTRVVNGVEEIVNIPTDKLILSPGIKLSQLLKTILGGIETNIDVDVRKYERITIKPREKINPCCVVCGVLTDNNNNGQTRNERVDDREIEMIVKEDGNLIISRPSPSSSPSPSPLNRSEDLDLQSFISNLSPKFQPSNGALVLSQTEWSSPMTPNRRPLIQKIEEIDGIWIGVGGTTTQGPAIGKKLAFSVSGI
ncbi:uncharacterized protein IL334_005822 [Kwoniella shivajii]|uniref:FAD dependent oxidoreductase domain-containing protein n=1 Tax=Kwoniella shivajii TaxID=564305 RepID=A0ABZ1D7A0_9TREE|nr:hypothetical protein IL334_005822 [Kwoniella shivajii]